MINFSIKQRLFIRRNFKSVFKHLTARKKKPKKPLQRFRFYPRLKSKALAFFEGG